MESFQVMDLMFCCKIYTVDHGELESILPSIVQVVSSIQFKFSVLKLVLL